jgi:hypothetical protein
MQQQSLEQRIDYIAQFALSEHVPEDVRVHFETGRNLFVYAWYSYRFLMVAEQHVLATLEMATRTRLEIWSAAKPPRGLSKLLHAARHAGFISNERFSAKDRWAVERARSRHDYAEIERMIRDGLDEAIIDHTRVVASEEDLSYDWLGNFIQTLPGVRNMYAHGSSELYSAIGRTFEVAVELINQLYENI